ncbi:MAG: hypothetical protein HY746_08375 [Elusimicrobia bacterium]|nr:hypothetical protein [Elusimicrobiota bacterium]
MKKLAIMAVGALLCLTAVSNPVRADSFDDFKAQIQALGKTYIEPFAEDFGGLLGGADFNSGRSVGFPGFDAGIVVVSQFKPSEDNKILKDAGVDAFGIPLVQASVGIPAIKMDAALRGLVYSGLKVIGGGVRYPFHKSGVAKFIPDVMVSAFYDTISHDYFKGSHYSFDVSASFDIPVIKPFAGIGYDKTKLEVESVSALLNGSTGSSGAMRYTAGVKFSPVPFLYVFGAYSIFHGESGAQVGAGAKF